MITYYYLEGEKKYSDLNKEEKQGKENQNTHQACTPNITRITFSAQGIPPPSPFTSLGVKMDAYYPHIQKLCQASFHYRENITTLHPSITLTDAKKLVSLSPPGWTTALLIPSKNIPKLQHIQNGAAKLLMRARKLQPTTSFDPQNTPMAPGLAYLLKRSYYC